MQLADVLRQVESIEGELEIVERALARMVAHGQSIPGALDRSVARTSEMVARLRIDLDLAVNRRCNPMHDVPPMNFATRIESTD